MSEVLHFNKRIKPADKNRNVWAQFLMPAKLMRDHALKIGDQFDLKARIGLTTFHCGRCYIGQKNYFFIGRLQADPMKAHAFKTVMKEIKFEATLLREPTITITSEEEGRRILTEITRLERRPSLAAEVKQLNRDQHSGYIVCEACGMASELAGLFDAHHLQPLCIGTRRSLPINFAVLCPTCHRWAHVLGKDRYHPLPVAEIRTACLV